MYPLFFPPQAAATPHAIPAPTCFKREVDYGGACAQYGVDVFRRPSGFCSYCGQRGKCECDGSSEATLQPGDIEVIAFQIQLYELGLDAEWIRKEVAFRGMESRERLCYEFDGTEKFFIDGVPSSRILPTGPAAPKALPLAAASNMNTSANANANANTLQKSPPQQHASPQRAPLVRRESRLRYVETASENATVKRDTQEGSKEEVSMMLGKMQLGGAENDIAAQPNTQQPATKRANRRRRGRNRATAYP